MNVPSKINARKNSMKLYHQTVHKLKKVEYQLRIAMRENEGRVTNEMQQLMLLTLILTDRKETLKRVLLTKNNKIL